MCVSPDKNTTYSLEHIKQILNQAFEETNAEVEITQGKITQYKKDFSIKAGTTAIVTLIINGYILVANASDSKALLLWTMIGGDISALPLSNDHNWGNRKEIDRLPSANKSDIIEDPRDDTLRIRAPNSEWIIGMSNSRGFGDKHINPNIICSPEVTGHQIDEQVKFIVQGSNRLFRIANNDRVANLVMNSQNTSDNNIAKNLIDTIAQKVVRHDITGMVINPHNIQEALNNGENNT